MLSTWFTVNILKYGTTNKQKPTCKKNNKFKKQQHSEDSSLPHFY